MKTIKKFADGENSILYVALIALGIGLLFATMCHSQTPVTTRTEFLTAIAKGDVILKNDIDLTGEANIPVGNKILGNGKTIHYKSLPATGEVFLFLLNGGTISDLTIFGPNGNVMAEGGYFGAVKTMALGGTITSVNFINCDKYGVYNMGVRAHQNDICKIENCTFTGIKRLGYGYGVWTQYGYTIIRNSIFQDGRHGIDGSSESNQYDVRGCTFAASFYNYPVHLHEYSGGKSGLGMIFKHNYLFGGGGIDIWPPFSGTTVIDSNYFEGSVIGRIGADQLPPMGNKINGKGMLPAPLANQVVTYKVGQDIAKIPATGYKTLYYPDGMGNKPSKLPRVKCFGVYGSQDGVRSITGYYTISVTDTGKYTGMWLKCFKTSVEVYVNGLYLETLSPTKWTSVLYRGVVTFVAKGDATGECYIDDFVKSGTSETFEVTNKIKVNGQVGTIKTGRFTGEKASGLWSFKFGFVTGGSVRLE